MRFVVLPGTRSAGLFSRRPAGTECGGLRSHAAARVSSTKTTVVRLILKPQ